MNPLFAFSGFLNFIVSVIFGILVYTNGRTKTENRYFTLFSFSVAFWSFGYYFWQTSNNSEDALFWCRLLMIGAIFIPLSYFQFVVSFLRQSRKKIIFLGYIVALFFLIFDTSAYFIQRVEPKMMFEFWPVPGILYPFFLLMFFGYVAYGWYLMIYSLNKIKQEDHRQQIKYVLFGTAIGFLGGSTNYLLWYNIPVPPYGNFLVIFYVIFAALAVLKYHLFEIRLIITELTVGVMSIILITLPFLMPTVLLKFITVIIFILFCIFGYYLIRATQQESKRREEAEMVAAKERELRHDAEILANNLKRLDAAKTQFLLSTQHHLRSPLSIVQGYLSLINEDAYGKIPAKAKEKINASLEATQKLIYLVDDLLDVAHFQMNKSKASKEPTDAINLIAGVVTDLLKLAQGKNLYLNFKPPSENISTIAIDSRSIREALYNIIDNAIKYTQEGGVTVSVATVGDKLRISVADTGIGMNEKDREGLFDRIFERGKKAQNVNVDGKDIGLYLAAQMIKSNGGTIDVKSEGWGEGTEFIIELPIDGVLPPAPPRR